MIVFEILDALFAFFGLFKRAGTTALTHARRDRVRAWAASTGRRYLALDMRLLRGAPFEVFRTRRGVAANVVSGTFKGTEATVFDFNCGSRGGTSAGTAGNAPVVYTCTVLSIAPHCPHIEIAPAPPGPDPTGRAIRFESERFNKTWHVRSDDRAFAVAAVDARMMAYLLSLEPLFTFEIAGNLLLARSPLLPPNRFDDLVAAARGVRDHLPGVLGAPGASVASRS